MGRLGKLCAKATNGAAMTEAEAAWSRRRRCIEVLSGCGMGTAAMFSTAKSPQLSLYGRVETT